RTLAQPAAARPGRAVVRRHLLAAAAGAGGRAAVHAGGNPPIPPTARRAGKAAVAQAALARVVSRPRQGGTGRVRPRKAPVMLEWLLLHTVTVGLLAGLVAALCRCRRLPPAAQHLLWLVVLVKLLTPPVLAWPWALPAPFAAPSAHYEPPAAIESEPRPEALEIVLAAPVA